MVYDGKDKNSLQLIKQIDYLFNRKTAPPLIKECDTNKAAVFIYKEAIGKVLSDYTFMHPNIIYIRNTKGGRKTKKKTKKFIQNSHGNNKYLSDEIFIPPTKKTKKNEKTKKVKLA